MPVNKLSDLRAGDRVVIISLTSYFIYPVEQVTVNEIQVDGRKFDRTSGIQKRPSAKKYGIHLSLDREAFWTAREHKAKRTIELLAKDTVNSTTIALLRAAVGKLEEVYLDRLAATNASAEESNSGQQP